MQKRIKSFDGTLINYEICCEKNNKNFLIFLHGAGGDLRVWKEVRLFFHKLKIPTIAIDLKGHGKSDKPKFLKSYRIENFARDIKKVIEEEKITNPIIIGHSLGGMVALTFHRLYPRLSKSYVIISSSYKSPRKLNVVFKKISFFVKFLNKKLKNVLLSRRRVYAPINKFLDGLKEDNIIRIADDAINTSFKSWLFTFENINKFNERETLRKLTKPVLILGGEKDSIINIKSSKRMHKMIRNSKLKIFPEGNHLLILTNPKEVSNEIYSFVKSLKNSTRKK